MWRRPLFSNDYYFKRARLSLSTTRCPRARGTAYGPLRAVLTQLPARWCTLERLRDLWCIRAFKQHDCQLCSLDVAEALAISKAALARRRRTLRRGQRLQVLDVGRRARRRYQSGARGARGRVAPAPGSERLGPEVRAAAAQKEEAELEATIDSARTALEGDVKALTDDLVAKALGRTA